MSCSSEITAVRICQHAARVQITHTDLMSITFRFERLQVGYQFKDVNDDVVVRNENVLGIATKRSCPAKRHDGFKRWVHVTVDEVFLHNVSVDGMLVAHILGMFRSTCNTKNFIELKLETVSLCNCVHLYHHPLTNNRVGKWDHVLVNHRLLMGPVK